MARALAANCASVESLKERTRWGSNAASSAIIELQSAINRFIEEANHDPKPFVWTADPDKIIAAVKRGHQALDPIH